MGTNAVSQNVCRATHGGDLLGEVGAFVDSDLREMRVEMELDRLVGRFFV